MESLLLFFSNISEVHHLAYFLIGVTLMGFVMGIAGFFHSRMLVRSLPSIVLTLNRENKKDN